MNTLPGRNRATRRERRTIYIIDLRANVSLEHLAAIKFIGAAAGSGVSLEMFSTITVEHVLKKAARLF
jgi:hypothetical protein